MSNLKGTLVLDPGHGGTVDIGGSDANYAGALPNHSPFFVHVLGPSRVRRLE